MAGGVPHALEDILASAARGGWDFFDGIDPRIRQMVELKQGHDQELAKKVARGWAKMLGDPDQLAALEALYDSTLRRATFFVQLGIPSDQVVQFGAFREGQNAVAHEIARQIAAGRGDPPPKPRER